MIFSLETCWPKPSLSLCRRMRSALNTSSYLTCTSHGGAHRAPWQTCDMLHSLSVLQGLGGSGALGRHVRLIGFSSSQGCAVLPCWSSSLSVSGLSWVLGLLGWHLAASLPLGMSGIDEGKPFVLRGLGTAGDDLEEI